MSSVRPVSSSLALVRLLHYIAPDPVAESKYRMILSVNVSALLQRIILSPSQLSPQPSSSHSSSLLASAAAAAVTSDNLSLNSVTEKLK